MSFQGWPAEALEFCDGLKADNSKAYRTEHRSTRRRPRGPMTALVEELAPESGDPKIFRPYRASGSARTTRLKLSDVVPWLEEPAVLRQVRVGARGKVETAGPSLPALHLRDAHVDPSSARVRVLRGVDPTHPFPARHRGDLVPQVLDLLRGSCQSCRKIRGHARLWPILDPLDVERRSVTRTDASSVLQRVIDPHPVAKISVWFEHRLEPGAIDRSVDGHLPARGQVLARRLRQPQHSRCVDRGQRGVETNGRSPCALRHRRLSSSPFRTRHPDDDTSSSASRLTLYKTQRPRNTPRRPGHHQAGQPQSAFPRIMINFG